MGSHQDLLSDCRHDKQQLTQRPAPPYRAVSAGLEDPGDRSLEAGMGIADHQPDPAKAADAHGPQELGPEGLRFRGPDAQADDLAAPFGWRPQRL